MCPKIMEMRRLNFVLWPLTVFFIDGSAGFSLIGFCGLLDSFKVKRGFLITKKYLQAMNHG